MAAESSSPMDHEPVLIEVLDGPQCGELLNVTNGAWSLGSSQRAWMRLSDGPSLHSTLHRQGDVLWIETADAQLTMSVNGRSVRRRALRDGDQIVIDGVQMQVHVGESARLAVKQVEFRRELGEMSAEQLCDAIEAEEAALHDMELEQRHGWQSLLTAVREAAQEGARPTRDEEDRRVDELVEHVRQMAESLEQRSQSLAERELELIDSAAELQSTQERLTQQLGEIIAQLSRQMEPSSELRASA